jgi:hypothetical protein
MNLSTIKLEIENLVISMYKQRFINEFDYLEENDTDRKGVLTKIINNVKTLKLEISTEKSILYDPNLVSDMMFRKTWKNLSREQKIYKMVEYVEDTFTDAALKKELSTIFNKLPKICGDNHIEYDYNKQKIIFMQCLFCNKNGIIIK